jgi:UDP-3-O-[3-hydroxymyristoyl] N-acetylglucosamine deacetylase
MGGLPMSFSRQTTLWSQATVTGVGVHSGKPVSLTLGPAPVDAGYIFVRTGLEGADREIQANAKSVIATEFATVLGDREGPLVSTAEHVLAALRGMGVDNATIEIDGPEVPIMDGSAVAFVAAIDQAGIVEQGARRRFIQVLKPVQVAIGDSFGEIRPHAAGFRAEVEINFANPVIGRQSYVLDLNPETFRRDIARARTFGCMNDVARLWSAGFALGASCSMTTSCSTPKACATPMNAPATRCWTPSAISRWPACRSSAPTARCVAATSSTMPCSAL